MMPSVPELRRFQVEKLANEITIKNPEVFLALAGAIALLFLSCRSERTRQLAATAMFIGNLLPLLIFFSRFSPSSPVTQWQALLAGGPEQQKIMGLLERDGRYAESAPGRSDCAVPGASACYYRIHSLNGFSAFFLFRPTDPEARRQANVSYVSTGKSEQGEATVLTTNQIRFVWATSVKREVAIISETLNTIRLRIEAGPAGDIIR